MRRAEALAEAQHRWGDLAWVRVKRTTPPTFMVGRATIIVGVIRQERTMATGESWEAAFAVADRSRARRGFTKITNEHTGSGLERRGVIDGGDRAPTLAECFEVLDLAAAHGVACVVWMFVHADASSDVVVIRRCACGEVAIREVACALCRAVEPLLTSSDPDSQADLHARHEAADRALDRIGAVVYELRRRISHGQP